MYFPVFGATLTGCVTAGRAPALSPPAVEFAYRSKKERKGQNKNKKKKKNLKGARNVSVQPNVPNGKLGKA